MRPTTRCAFAPPEDAGHAAPAARRNRAGGGEPVAVDMKSRRWLRVGAIALSIGILGLSAFIVTRTLLETDYHQLRLAIQATSMEQFLLAAVFTALSYLALTGYDALALRQLKLRVKYRTAALASFSSYAISFTMGFPLITGGTVRYWIYSQAGLTASLVASLTLIAGITFWLGMLLVLGVSFLLKAEALANINQFKPAINLLIGTGLITAIALYLYWVGRSRRRLSVSGMVLELPGFKLTLGQVMLGGIDLFCAAAALFVLLPEGHGVEYLSFLAVYVFGTLVGIASHAPGGIGAFEVTILKTVPAPSVEALLASLLLFRLVYYFVPFVLAFALLGAHEILRRWRELRGAMRRTGVDKASP